MTLRLLIGDCRDRMAELPDESVQTIVTSPPYWGLRDYGVDGQMGLEESPAAYVEAMRAVFAEARRVLRKDGTLWLNLGDSFARGCSGSMGGSTLQGSRTNQGESRKAHAVRPKRRFGRERKNQLGIPWRVAFALQDDGWILRSDIVWAKPAPMPESVLDRPTRAHEYVFLFARSRRYFYDASAIAEPASSARASGNGFRRAERLSHTDASGRVAGNDERVGEPDRHP